MSKKMYYWYDTCLVPELVKKSEKYSLCDCPDEQWQSPLGCWVPSPIVTELAVLLFTTSLLPIQILGLVPSPPLLHVIHCCPFLPVACCTSVRTKCLGRRKVGVQRKGVGLSVWRAMVCGVYIHKQYQQFTGIAMTTMTMIRTRACVYSFLLFQTCFMNSIIVQLCDNRINQPRQSTVPQPYNLLCETGISNRNQTQH